MLKYILIYDEVILYMYFLKLYFGFVKYYVNVEKLFFMI